MGHLATVPLLVLPQTRSPRLLGAATSVTPGPPLRTAADSFMERVEDAARSLRRAELSAFLAPLCKDRDIGKRDVTDPRHYLASAEWSARQFERLEGIEGLGDHVKGGSGYLQPFWFETRYGDRQVLQSWNVIARLRSPRPTQKTMVLIGHLDALSRAEREWYREKKGRDLSQYEGASDNATAVTILHEMARVLPGLGPLPFDVIFLVSSGEEEAMCGVRAFIMDSPVPLSAIGSVLNFEMAGLAPASCLSIAGGTSNPNEDRNPLFHRAVRVGRQGHPAAASPVSRNYVKAFQQTELAPFGALGTPSVLIIGDPSEVRYHQPHDRQENLHLDAVKAAAELGLRVIADLALDPYPSEQHGMIPIPWRPFTSRVAPGAEPPDWALAAMGADNTLWWR